MLGICNGFQVLCESHLLPGALTRNDAPALRLPRPAAAGRERRPRPGPAATRPARRSSIPLKNGEGGYVADDAHARRAGGARAGSSSATSAATPTARCRDIAGITQRARQRRRPHAAPRARGRGADRPVDRRPRLLHLRPHDSVGDRVTASMRHGRHRQARRGRRPDDRAALRRARACKDDEYDRIREILGRRPTVVRAGDVLGHVERALLVQVEQGAPAPVRREGRRRPTRLLVGIGENAGVVDIGDGWAVTFKVESHNHPSLRRALPGRGHRRRRHRPRHPRRWAPGRSRSWTRCASARPTTRTPRRVLPGVVAGIGGYGNCLGLPNIGGEVVFDPSLPGQPAGQRAVRRRHAARATSSCASASGAGNMVVLFGAQDRRRRHRRRLASWRQRDLRRRRARRKRPSGPGRRPVRGEGAHRVLPRAVRAPTWSSASRTSAAPGCPARPQRAGHRNGDGGMHVELDRVPLRDAVAGARTRS